MDRRTLSTQVSTLVSTVRGPIAAASAAWATSDGRWAMVSTSITAFVERKWNLPAMTFRDANAQPMTDYFDFRKPAFATPPRLAAAPGLNPGVAKCHAAGLNPPLPGTAGSSQVASDVARGLLHP